MITKITRTNTDKNVFHFMEIIPDCRINLLFGANGSGKSSLLNGIQECAIRKANGKKYSYCYCDNLAIQTEEGIKTQLLNYADRTSNYKTQPSYSALGSMDAFFGAYATNHMSEGESILYSVTDLFIGLSDTSDDSPFPMHDKISYTVLLDEIDSGLSINHIEEICKCIDKIIDLRNDVQFFIAFNNYQFVHHYKKVLSMYTGQFIEIKDYDEYISILNKNEKILQCNRGKTRVENDGIRFNRFINPYKALCSDIKKRERKETKKNVL